MLFNHAAQFELRSLLIVGRRRIVGQGFLLELRRFVLCQNAFGHQLVQQRVRGNLGLSPLRPAPDTPPPQP